MDFEPEWAILAGLVGGAVMAIMLYMGILMLPQQVKMNLFMMMGSMMLPVGAAAFVMGAMVHAGLSVVFGLIHGAVFAVADIESAEAAWGLLFGLVHWAAVGIAFGMLPMMHPRMRYEGPRLIPQASGSQELLDPPGFYALSYPPINAIGSLVLHLVFGVIVGALYGWWAG